MKFPSIYEEYQDVKSFTNNMDNSNKHGNSIFHKLKNVIELPDVWKRSNSYLLNKNKNMKLKYTTTPLLSDSGNNEPFDILLPNQINDVGPLISQTIYSRQEKRMTFSQIKSKLKASSDDQTITTRLKSHKYFRKVTLNKKTYWQVDENSVKNTPFGQNLIDTGFVGGFEYWDGKKPIV